MLFRAAAVESSWKSPRREEQMQAQVTPSSDMQAFRNILAKAEHILALSGAGISAESGVPTFRLARQNCVVRSHMYM